MNIELKAGINSNKEFAEKIFNKLVSVVDNPPNDNWPPELIIRESEDINAFVYKGKIFILTGILDKVIKNNSSKLAFILGHELSHILLGHTSADFNTKYQKYPDFYILSFSRDDEIQADTIGMKLALKAGYSYKEARGILKDMRNLNLDYSSFEGSGSNHPSWTERAEYIDKGQSNLWHSMGAFDNGTRFLMLEQYAAAVRCFQEVTEQFNNCYEAWANLGYARLMQYCDAMDIEQIKNIGIGQIVIGGFYRRPASLEKQIKGMDESLWFDAVAALEKALLINPDLTIVKANLGVAYLLKPSGSDLGKSKRYFDEALNIIKDDNSIDELTKASIYINAGVREIKNNGSGSSDYFDKANKCRINFLTSESAFYGNPSVNNNAIEKSLQHNTKNITGAILYNKSFSTSLRTTEDYQKKIDLLETYLSEMNYTSLWWQIAYEKYVDCCDHINKSVKSKNEFIGKQNTNFRPVISIEFQNGTGISLSESISKLKKEQKNFREISIIENTNLVKLVYRDKGIDIIGSVQVLAIILSGNNSPSFKLTPSGLNSKPVEIKCGMMLNKIDALKNEYCMNVKDINQKADYRYYQDLGFAILTDKEGKISEIVIAQVPVGDSRE